MRSAGPDTVLAHWRETGAWWCDEPGLEIRRIVRDGRMTEVQTALPALLLNSRQTEYEQDAREDVDLRARKTRDEKVAAANGKFPESYYIDASRERIVPSRPIARKA